MRLRCERSVPELPELYAWINAQLDEIGLGTDGSAAVQLLALAASPDAGPNDFARVIRTDTSLTGRVLHLANSAFFSPVDPVGEVERACVMLGANRLRALAVTVTLAASQAAELGSVFRTSWNQSMYRASMATVLAHQICPAYAGQAFVIGALQGAGVPLLARIVGEPFLQLLRANLPPPGFLHEQACTLEATHIDVAVALCRRWSLPEIVTWPITWQHQAPATQSSNTAEQYKPINQLHRLAFAVGQMELGEDGCPISTIPLPPLARQHLALEDSHIARVMVEANTEFMDIVGAFSSERQSISPAQFETLRRRLAAEIDQEPLTMIEQSDARRGRFRFGTEIVEVEFGRGGNAVAYLCDSAGARLVGHYFMPGKVAPITIVQALAIDTPDPAELDRLTAYLGDAEAQAA